MRDFKNLIVWKKSHENALFIYGLTKVFPTEEQSGLSSQLRRASVSIPTNIAEGCGKFTQKDIANIQQISLGSSHEIEYLKLLSFELKYIGETNFKNLHEAINEVNAMLIALIKKVR